MAIGTAGAAASGTAGGGGSGSREPEPRVYWGKTRGTRVRNAGRGRSIDGTGFVLEMDDKAPPRDNLKTYSQALSEFYRWSDTQRREWGDYLVSIGFIDEDFAAAVRNSLAATFLPRDVVERVRERHFTWAG